MQTAKISLLAGIVSLFATMATAASPSLELLPAAANDPQSITLADGGGVAALVVDAKDDPVVTLAANLLADDIGRVTGRRPAVGDKSGAPQMIIAGTLGHSPLVDGLASGGRLKGLDGIRGRWEATLSQVVEKPFPGVQKALVIVGSDRRGTAYGLMRVSETIGVSPWYWWADVPAKHRDVLALRLAAPQTDAPAVKYRGIFINDEDWGLNAWASTTFDPEFKNIGPKTYEKVFELMLRLRLNYIWPAMHRCSAEFGSVPENAALADRYGIVAGASHCEPMLYNNVKWDPKGVKGPWNYATNREVIRSVWEENAKARGSYEAVWTVGIRGIHDGAMNGPKELPDRIALVSEVIKDQRALLEQYVTGQRGPAAQCFVPYKEVQVIYDGGLQVPSDVTLVWADDNFGYLRRLSSAAERQRSGGAGFYYHLSYYGRPHSYTWVNTTAPALMWEEMHKAWQNEARTIWMLNVGDIKPAEIGIDYYSRLAWNPDGFGADCQQPFLKEFAARNFGEKAAGPMANYLTEYYRLGTIRKPETMQRAWALALSKDEAAKLENDYKKLLEQAAALTAALPAESRDAFTEMVGFPARVLGTTGLIFLADRRGQTSTDTAGEIARLRNDLQTQVENFNTRLAGGKWKGMMPGLVTSKKLDDWSSQVRWPWGERPAAPGEANPPDPGVTAAAGRSWRDAASAERQMAAGEARWTVVPGLGPSGRAMSLQPTTLATAWPVENTAAPALEYSFETKGGDANAFIDFLPTFRLVPGMQLRVSLRVDNGPARTLEVPGGNGKEDENGEQRRTAVQDNFARLQVPLPGLIPGKHTFKIGAVDPGVVIDRLSLP